MSNYIEPNENICLRKFLGQGEVADAVYEVGSFYGYLPLPVKDGYHFEGWYSEPNGMGVEITAESVVEPGENRRVYAHWSAKQVTVTFDANGGEITSNIAKKTGIYSCGVCLGEFIYRGAQTPIYCVCCGHELYDD